IAAAFGWDLMLYGRGTGGSQRFRSGRSGAGRRRRGWQVAAALAAAAAISLAVDRSPEVVLVWALLAGVPLAARWRPSAGALALVAALALDLVPWSQRLLPHGEPSLFYPPNPLPATLARETGGGGWRSVGMDLLVY